MKLKKNKPNILGLDLRVGWCSECLWRPTAAKWTKRLSSTHARITPAQLESIDQIRCLDFNKSQFVDLSSMYEESSYIISYQGMCL